MYKRQAHHGSSAEYYNAAVSAPKASIRRKKMRELETLGASLAGMIGDAGAEPVVAPPTAEGAATEAAVDAMEGKAALLWAQAEELGIDPGARLLGSAK